MDHIIKLRRELHQNPELSNKEFETSQKIMQFMSALKPDRIIHLSKTGLAFSFDSDKPGSTSMFRAELDALPIKEINTFAYKSQNDAMHACGHDGHMAILAALGEKISANRPVEGRVILLFQPAEEVEQGARDVVNDLNFKSIIPDYVFALHNIPGIPKNQILVKEGSIAAASRGMTIKLFGKTSHAAEPENGINPDIAISHIVSEFHKLKNSIALFDDIVLLTFIHIQLGEISFGTSAGYAEIRVTLRAFENADMELLIQKCEEIVNQIAIEENLQTEILYSEIFPATINDKTCVEIIEKSAIMNNLIVVKPEKPFKWSEDFAYFTQKFKGGLFGLGAGENQKSLHNPDYDFPDDIVETGVNTMFEIYKKIHF